MRRACLLLLSLAIVTASGCITATTVVNLKPNGSGTMEATVLMNTAAFKSLGSMLGGESKSEGRSSMPSAEELSKELSKLKGVRLVSQTPIKDGDSEGAKVVLAFDDVNEIAVSEGLPGQGGRSRKGDDVKFALTRQPNGNALLSVEFPDRPGRGTGKTAAEDKPKSSSNKPDAETMKMISAFFKGLRVMIAVDVDGTLVRTSSPYVEGNRVTLLDFDMDQLLTDPAALDKLDALPLGPDLSMTEAREAMARAGVKGLKINDPKITIEFK